MSHRFPASCHWCPKYESLNCKREAQSIKTHLLLQKPNGTSCSLYYSSVHLTHQSSFFYFFTLNCIFFSKRYDFSPFKKISDLYIPIYYLQSFIHSFIFRSSSMSNTDQAGCSTIKVLPFYFTNCTHLHTLRLQGFSRIKLKNMKAKKKKQTPYLTEK